ncbi:MAG: class III signal peptide-containing protein [Methanobacterium sp.]|nr:class III signal peptide-containing protein [Methanobacterium sp.]
MIPKSFDDSGQISAEMILLIGAMLVIVIVAGGYILGITQSIAGNITSVTNTARDTTINRM